VKRRRQASPRFCRRLCFVGARYRSDSAAQEQVFTGGPPRCQGA